MDNHKRDPSTDSYFVELQIETKYSAFILEPEYLTPTPAKPNRAKATLLPYPCPISSLPIQIVLQLSPQTTLLFEIEKILYTGEELGDFHVILGPGAYDMSDMAMQSHK